MSLLETLQEFRDARAYADSTCDDSEIAERHVVEAQQSLLIAIAERLLTPEETQQYREWEQHGRPRWARR